MIGQRVLSLFRRRDASPDYLKSTLKRDKKIFLAEKKKADKQQAKMLKLFRRQPAYARVRYSHSVCDITDAFCLINKDLITVGYRRNLYPALTSEIKHYTKNMEGLIASMEKTKNNIFMHYYQKVTGSNN